MSLRADSGRKIRVALTGAGGSGAMEILSALRKTGRYHLIGLDASEHSAGFSVSDQARMIPFATTPEFLPAMAEILRKDKPDFLIPLVDEEILPLHELLTLPEHRQVRLVCPAQEFCRMALDKWATHVSLADAGLPTPVSCLASSPQSAPYPAIIKPRNGRGSRGVALLSNPQELAAYLTLAKQDPAEFIIQQHIAGPEYTVSATVGLDGEVLAVVPKEVLIKRGITLVGATRQDDAIEALCRKIQAVFQANGPFNVQLIKSADGIPQVIEINPRYSTTAALTIAAGVDEVDLVIRKAMGERVAAQQFTPDLLMVRHYAHIYCQEQQWKQRHLL